MKHRGFFLVPAGILIGLGIGIVLGYQISGLIIGFGAGFLLSFGRREGYPSPEDPAGTRPGWNTAHGILVILALYIIASGFAIIWVPKSLWWDIAAGFLILAGAWVIAYGYYRS